MEFKDIKELIMMIDKTSINEVEIKENDLKIRISKEKQIVTQAPQMVSVLSESQNQEVAFSHKSEIVQSPEVSKAETKPAEDENMFIVKSPIVGTFYGSPSPDSDDYVSVGSKVKAGDVVCIVEAMKIMNEIKSEVDGEVYEILVENEDIVEYNQPLMIIRR